ncbi:hypothetical protein [Botrimarina colliarenosi]|nr:hypothetical protein [Botrimarina colliarenosi]
MTHPALGLSAASLVLLCGVAAMWSVLGGPATPAYAQLVEPLLEAKSGSFSLVVLSRGKEVARGKGYFRGPMSRIEKPGDAGSFTIFDGVNGKSLDLSSTEKTATLADIPFFERDKKVAPELMKKYGGGMLGAFRMYLDPACNLKAFGAGCSRDVVEESAPGGGKRRGVRLSTPGMVQTLWADPETGEPDRVEIEIKRIDGVKTVLADFDFNAEPEESLFEMSPPGGYTLDDRTE